MKYLLKPVVTKHSATELKLATKNHGLNEKIINLPDSNFQYKTTWLFLVPHESPQKVLYYKVNIIHFTTIDKSSYTTLVMLSSVVGTDVRTKGLLMSLMWKEAGVPGENPGVQAGDHHTLSHTTTVEYGNRTRIAAQ